MIFPVEHILVLGHKHPDTDACTSAQAYANLLNRIGAYDSPVIAGVIGDLTPQSRYVFDVAKVPPPPRVDDLWPRVRDVATREVLSISLDDRLRKAIELLIESEHSMLPVVNHDGKLHSVFSHRRDVSRFLLELDVLPILSTVLTWSDIVSLPGVRLMGRRSEVAEIRGQLIFALEGAESWRSDVRSIDILVCGDLSVVLTLPADRIPLAVVLVQSEPPPSAQVAEVNDRGAYVLQYLHQLGDFLAALKAQIRVGALNLGSGPCVGELDRLQDASGIIHASRCAVPVVDGNHVLTGVVSRKDLSTPPRRRIILVDHFEASQTVSGIDFAEILEIVDHHRIGDIETASPARVNCRPVGSASTIVALRYLEEEVSLDVSTATLLLGGLVADTLCLTSPTTTHVDSKVAGNLERIVGTSIQEFGRDVLEAGDDLLTATPSEIWNRDQKVFSIRNRTFAVAQLETVCLDSLTLERLTEFRELLQNDAGKTDHLANLLFITDVLSGDSWVTFCEAPEVKGVVAPCFGTTETRPGWTLAPNIVSRKKQIVPSLLQAFAERQWESCH